MVWVTFWAIFSQAHCVTLQSDKAWFVKWHYLRYSVEVQNAECQNIEIQIKMYKKYQCYPTYVPTYPKLI
jgi:hypothetical protein